MRQAFRRPRLRSGPRLIRNEATPPVGFAATTSPARASFDKYKVAVPAANGWGQQPTLGVALNNPGSLEPGVAVTQTFLTIGAFDTEAEARPA